MANNRFGSATSPSQTYLADASKGWGTRGYNWQVTGTLQYELRPGLGAYVSYFGCGTQTYATDNRAVTPADYDPYWLTVPVDSRLPLSGQQLCGLYDVNPSRFGQVDNAITHAANFGKQIETYNGVDIGFTARFAKTGMLAGGVSFGQTVTDNCFVVDSPQLKTGVGVTWRPLVGRLSGEVQWRVSAAVVGPGAELHLPESARTSDCCECDVLAAPRSRRPSGGMSRPARTRVTIPLLFPQSVFEKRLTQFDVRLAKDSPSAAAHHGHGPMCTTS